ncbi:MAG: hypothetical protein IPK13_18105 [Deltaproteobacteria bacterium]|nr:hypothetical protein [Deltaproteobacteria bacterium]
MGHSVRGHYNACKVFSATKAREREEIGETVTRWLSDTPDIRVVETVVTQSSDNEFHCLTITIFYERAN